MIVIPMAGLSSRFFKEGYTLPKYMLDLNGITVFEWSVSSFEKYFNSDFFLFIIFDHFDTKNFVEQQIKNMGIHHYKVVVLTEHTLGQADTVYQGLRDLEIDEEMYIFNIDSRLDNFSKWAESDNVDGYLEVFRGEGEHWSFVLSGHDHQVLKTTEKDRISDLCSNGLYYFKSSMLYKKYMEEAIKNYKNQEIYIAPLYNQYIRDDKKIHYKLVELGDIQFCGTPLEYKQTVERIQQVKL